MNTSKCPSCGAALVENSSRCSVCHSDLDWQDGQPVVTSAGRALRQVAIVTLLAVAAAVLVLTVTLLVIT